MKRFFPGVFASKMFVFICLFWVATISPAMAQWTLNNQHSQLNFISIKKGDVAEIHSFRKLNGEINSSGGAIIIIDLSSVDTLIPIRDQRMREMLFNVVKFPDARFHAQLDMQQIDAIQPGSSKQLTVMGDFTLHGQTKQLELKLLVSRLNKESVQVFTYQPILIHAKDFALTAGVEKLREVAGLPSISNAVPISFILQFDK